MPAFEMPAPPALENPGWGPWLDLAQSRPPKQQPAPQKVEQQKPQARPINTKVDLVGIIGFGSMGVAIMRVNGSQESVYNQGDSIDDGIVLERIEINGIVLSNGEREKTYSFPQVEGLVDEYKPDEATLPKAAPIARIEQPSAPTKSPQQSQPQQTKPKPKSIPKPQSAPPKVEIAPKTKQQIEELREQPLKATQYADTELVQRDGQIYGVRIGQLRNPALFAALGLNSNDVVLSVNGVAVAELARDPVRAQAMLREKSFRLEIIRNGAKQTVNFTWPR